ncbi:MAG: penicillin-binding protein 2 [Endomicrobiia bacterium]|nr:penicillin-binding protein 2 [Endomicrobiia bacterium]
MMAKKRFSAIFSLVCAVCLAMAARLFMVQVWSPPDGKDAFAPSETTQNGPRGSIYDRNGEVLAMSRKMTGIFVDAKLAQDAGGSAVLYEKIKSFAPVGRDELERMIATKRRYIPLDVEFSADEVHKIRAMKIPGIGLEERVRRVYPEGDLAREILGVCGRHAKTGAELTFDSQLSGRAVLVRRQRDGAGRSIPEDVYFEELAKGSDVYLTIDKNIQYIAERAASEAMDASGSERVVIIVQNPADGEILAAATREKKPSSRIAPIAEVFEPGSTFKIFTYALAISEGVIKEDELIFCENGSYKIYDKYIGDHEKKGMLTVRESFAFSSNIACAKISQRLGLDKIKVSVRNFGFGTPSGINLPGEEKGLMPPKWDPFTTATVSFGQGIGVTPIQIVNAYSAIANGGWLLEPRVVKKIVSENPRRQVTETQRKVVRRVADDNTVENLKEMLGDVVSYGTGKYSAVAGYTIGGKTGTAQKIDSATGRYSKKYYVSSFCGIMPLDEPRLTVFVMVDSPVKGDYWGSTVAAPVFARVAGATAAYMRIPPSPASIRLVSTK